MRRGTFFFIALTVTALAACSSGDSEQKPPWAGLVDYAAEAARPRLPTRTIDEPCRISVSTPRILRTFHLRTTDQSVAYSSEPASSGPHDPVWAAYRDYPKPVDPRYYVHDLEHGAMAFFYRCASRDECPDSADTLDAFVESLPADAACGPEDPPRRALVAPDPRIGARFAAAAWGAVYEAECFDPDSLRAFYDQYYAHGPEASCWDGDPHVADQK